MKKLTVLFAALTLTLGSFAQTMDKMQEPMQDCVMMKDGKVMQMKSGQTMVVDKNLTLANGATVMSNGAITMKDGSKMQLKNGDCMDMSGNMITMNGDMMMQNCMMMKDGKMMVMKDGKTMAMDKEMKLDNGARVMTDGTVMMKDGTKKTLKNGECIDMKGKIQMSDKEMDMDKK